MNTRRTVALTVTTLAIITGAATTAAATPHTKTIEWTMSNGGTPQNVTWPQTPYAGECGVWIQVDVYPYKTDADRARTDALDDDGYLTRGEDHGWVKSWTFRQAPPCATPTPTPTPEPTWTPSPTPTPSASASPSTPPFSTPSPTSSPTSAPTVEPSPTPSPSTEPSPSTTSAPAPSATPTSDPAPSTPASSPAPETTPPVTSPATNAATTSPETWETSGTELAATGTNTDGALIAGGLILIGGTALALSRIGRKR